MAIGNTYHIKAPWHYAPILFGWDAMARYDRPAVYAAAKAFEHHLISQGRVLIGVLDAVEFAATYKAMEVA